MEDKIIKTKKENYKTWKIKIEEDKKKSNKKTTKIKRLKKWKLGKENIMKENKK